MKAALAAIAMAVMTPLACPSASAAGPCFPVQVEPHSAYRYLDAFSMALGYTKTAIHEVDSVGAGKSESWTMTDVVSLMSALKLGKSDLECAMALVGPYMPPPEPGTHKQKMAPADTSWDARRVEMIGTSARGAFAALTALVRIQDRSIATYERWLNSSKGIKPGTAAREAADLEDAKHNAMRMLLNSGIGAAWTVVEPDPVTGKMSRLTLTASERDDILKTLRTFFGEAALVDESDPDPEVPTATAATLYRFLKDPGRTVRSAE
jgi:hypothetical protein